MARLNGGSATSVSLGSVSITGTSDVNIKQVGGAAFSLGQQLAASSLPVVLTAAQLSTLTPLSTISNISQIASVTPTFGDVSNVATITGALNVSTIAKYNNTLPTLTDTQFNILNVGSRGALRVEIFGASSTNSLTVATAADTANLTGAAKVYAQNGVYNGSSVDLWRSIVNANNTTGTGIGAVGLLAQFDDVSPTAITENQFGNVRMSVRREVYDQIRDAAGNERGVNVTAGNALQADLTSVAGTSIVTAGVAGTQAVGGNVATNVAIGTNPINTGAQAVSSENSAVTTARMVQLVADLVGKLIVLPYANPENFVNGTTAAITDTTSTAVISAQAAGVRTYLTQITVTNSHATVGTFVKILDGATIIHEGYAAAAGGGYTATFPTPLRGTAATAINCQPVTTGANVIASMSGYKGV